MRTKITIVSNEAKHKKIEIKSASYAYRMRHLDLLLFITNKRFSENYTNFENTICKAALLLMGLKKNVSLDSCLNGHPKIRLYSNILLIFHGGKGGGDLSISSTILKPRIV